MSLRLPVSPSMGAYRVWRRNLTVSRRTMAISFLPPLLEPVFYLLAFGLGLGALVGEVGSSGGKVPYVLFIAPALLAIQAANNSFFENTYASFVRMHYQRTFDAMLATPLTLDDVITGEIAWGATRAAMATGLMMAVITPFGLVPSPWVLLGIPLAFLGGLAFGSLGMIFTAILPTIETFNIPVFLLVTPMFLFSGTFFPLEQLPAWARLVADLLPLTHLVVLFRGAAAGTPLPGTLVAIVYLVAFTAVTYPAAVLLMRKRLIK
jgi:lipooligosaccharide transport system permease protein